MKRALGLIVAALFVACSGDRPLMPNVNQPLASISDGNHSDGNPDFFFLPPLVPSPSGNTEFQPALFNAALVPVVDVCELSGNPSSGPVSCVRTAFGPVSVTAGSGHYHVNWHTNESNGGAGLSVVKFYRIRVFGSLNGTLLGFADVDPVSTGKELKNIQTNDIIGLVDGRTLPIKFSIEQGALCDPPGTSPCATKTFALTEGVTVVLATGDRVIVPPQPDRPGQVITLSIQPCPPLPIDNPKAGPCLNVIPSPPLVGPLTNRARVLLCSLDREADLGGLTHEQTHLLKVHRLDEGPPVVVQALPETSAAECAGIGSTKPKTFLGWLGHLAWSAIAPRELRASRAVLDVGEGGSTDFFSHFQLRLPVKMQAASSTELTGTPGVAVAPSPQVLVTDFNDDPVAGVKVHFQITSTGGGTVTPIEVLTDDLGHATVSAWVLGAAGAHTLRAFGFGIADPSNNGPQDGFDPFQPDISLDLEDQDPVPVETGQVLFNATATAAGGSFSIQPLVSELEYPDGMWLRGGFAYVTETNGRNTIFGGRIRLSRFNLATGAFETLINNPVNSDAVVVDDGGTIYLTSYETQTPGEQGNVSTVHFDADLGWVETHLTELGIASLDMVIDANEVIYVIGSSSQSDAPSLYRLNPELSVVARGLGGAQSLTTVGSAIYYSTLNPAEVRRISEAGNQLVIEAQVIGLTSDGTWLYFAEVFAGRIRRRHLTTGAEQTVMEGLNTPQNVRWFDGKLYVLEAGTQAGQYKNGRLAVITENVIP